MAVQTDDLAIDIKMIRKTVGRIEEALNRRFEKDASLYISNQKLQEIKELLNKSEFAKLYGLYTIKEHSPEILINVMIRNAWLINEIREVEINRYIRPIFKEANIRVIFPVIKEAIENRLQIPFVLKEFLLSIYYNCVPIHECERVLENPMDAKLVVLKSCLIRVIQAEQDINRTYLRLKRFMNDERLVNDRNILVQVFHHDKYTVIDKQVIAEKIYTDFFVDAINKQSLVPFCWVGGFVSLGPVALDVVVKQLQSTSVNDRYKRKMLTSNQILGAMVGKSDITEEDLLKIVRLYKDNNEVRYNLNYTLKFIKKEEVQQFLYHEFSKVNPDLAPPTDNAEEELTEQQLADLIDNDSSSARIVTMMYKADLKKQKKLVQYILDNYYIDDVEELIALYFSRLRKFEKEIIGPMILKYFEDNRDELTDYLIKSFLTAIEKNTMKDPISREFMQEHDFERFQRVFSN